MRAPSYSTSRAQNPTGAAIGEGRAGELCSLLSTYPDVTVLEDDHGVGIVDEPLWPVVGTTRNWVFVRSAAKAYGPDLRVAVVAGDEPTIGRIDASLALGAGWVSHILQGLLLDLWGDPEVEQLLASAVAGYDARRVALLEALAAHGVAARAERAQLPDPRRRRGRLRRRAVAGGVAGGAGEPVSCRGRRRRSGSPPRRFQSIRAAGLAAAIDAALGGGRGAGARRLA